MNEKEQKETKAEEERIRENGQVRWVWRPLAM